MFSNLPVDPSVHAEIKVKWRLPEGRILDGVQRTIVWTATLLSASFLRQRDITRFEKYKKLRQEWNGKERTRQHAWFYCCRKFMSYREVVLAFTYGGLFLFPVLTDKSAAL